jgi:hypothetical protein
MVLIRASSVRSGPLRNVLFKQPEAPHVPVPPTAQQLHARTPGALKLFRGLHNPRNAVLGLVDAILHDACNTFACHSYGVHCAHCTPWPGTPSLARSMLCASWIGLDLVQALHMQCFWNLVNPSKRRKYWRQTCLIEHCARGSLAQRQSLGIGAARATGRALLRMSRWQEFPR